MNIPMNVYVCDGEIGGFKDLLSPGVVKSDFEEMIPNTKCHNALKYCENCTVILKVKRTGVLISDKQYIDNKTTYGNIIHCTYYNKDYDDNKNDDMIIFSKYDNSNNKYMNRSDKFRSLWGLKEKKCACGHKKQSHKKIKITDFIKEMVPAMIKIILPELDSWKKICIVYKQLSEILKKDILNSWCFVILYIEFSNMEWSKKIGIFQKKINY